MRGGDEKRSVARGWRGVQCRWRPATFPREKDHTSKVESAGKLWSQSQQAGKDWRFGTVLESRSLALATCTLYMVCKRHGLPHQRRRRQASQAPAATASAELPRAKPNTATVPHCMRRVNPLVHPPPKADCPLLADARQQWQPRRTRRPL